MIDVLSSESVTLSIVLFFVYVYEPGGVNWMMFSLFGGLLLLASGLHPAASGCRCCSDCCRCCLDCCCCWLLGCRSAAAGCCSSQKQPTTRWLWIGCQLNDFIRSWLPGAWRRLFMPVVPNRPMSDQALALWLLGMCSIFLKWNCLEYGAVLFWLDWVGNKRSFITPID